MHFLSLMTSVGNEPLGFHFSTIVHGLVLLGAFQQVNVGIIKFDTELAQEFLGLCAPPAGGECI